MAQSDCHSERKGRLCITGRHEAVAHQLSQEYFGAVAESGAQRASTEGVKGATANPLHAEATTANEQFLRIRPKLCRYCQCDVLRKKYGEKISFADWRATER